jgi:metabotropic glutamate receptor 2/3/metabotropic glutamate receptor 6/7/8
MYASSDILSNKMKFPYFNRMVPPSTFDMHGVLSLLEYFKWTYVHVLHAQGGYGSAGFAALKEGLLKYPNVCIASQKQVPKSWTHEEEEEMVETIVNEITSCKNSRVVISVLEKHQVDAIVEKMKISKKVSPGELIWVFVDEDYSADNSSFVEGSFLLKTMPETVNVPDYDKWFEQQTLENAIGDPWFPELFAHFCKCSLANNADNPCNYSLSIGKCGEGEGSTYSGLLFDGVIMAAEAAGRVLLSEKCGNGTPSERLDKCVNRQWILEEMRKTTINNYTGLMNFNKNGDRLSNYSVLQMTKTLATNSWR